MSIEDDILLRKSALEHDYNRTREILHNQIDIYYRQDIASQYIDESELIKLVNRCIDIKSQYKEVRDQLLQNKEKTHGNRNR